MHFLASLRSLAAKFVRRSQTAQDLDDELRSHIAHRAADLIRTGLNPTEAERRAHIEFGGQVRFKEESQEALGGIFFETMLQDIRVALRVLRKAKGFTAAAVVTLALAISANAIVFGILNGLVLRPLNVPHPEKLWSTMYGDNPVWQSFPNFLDLRERNRSFEDLAAFKFVFVGLDRGKDPVAATGLAATGNYFDVLRIHPYLGRAFHASDEHGPNSAPYLVLSYAYWQRRFAGDRTVIGRAVRINKHPFTIIGVAPRDFVGTLLFISPDFFMPIVNQEQADGENLLDARASKQGLFEIFGRLKPEVSPAQATADLNRVGAYLEATYPKNFAHRTSSLTKAGLTSFGPALKGFVAALMSLAGLILLAACANLGSLFAAHAADRSRDVALRLALGSTAARILRQLFTEAMLISLFGGLAGLQASILALNRLSTWQPFSQTGMRLPVNPDAAVYLVSLALALLSGLLFGLVPVRQVLRTDPYGIIKAGSNARPGRRITVRDALLVVQIAICAVLVTSSAVAVRGLVRSLYANFGFEPRHAMLANVNLAMAGYPLDAVPAMQKRMIEATEKIDGIASAGLVNNYPPLVYLAGERADVFRADAGDLNPAHAAARPYNYRISPGYLQAAGTALLAGRSFSWHDDKNAPAVAVVNQEFARKLFGSVTNAVGANYRLGNGSRVQIVGVVENGKYQVLTEDQQPAMFLPFLQSPAHAAFLVARSNRDGREIAAAIRRELHRLDDGLPVDTETWGNMLHLVQFPARIATLALGTLGLMGALLSVTGIFGMAAYSVSKRLKELGIRIAVGARPKEILQTALGRALKLLAIGSAAGLVLGLLASRVLASIVYSANPRDPVVLGGTVIVMTLLGLLATVLPAQRALSLDPLRLLREE